MEREEDASSTPFPGGADDYIRDSIHDSLGLPVSDRSLRLKLLASEDHRRRLQDHVFALEEDLRAAARRIEQLKAESAMNAAGLRRCIEEKETMVSAYNDLSSHSAKLERECTLYERDLERAMESCDDLAKENDEMRARLNDHTTLSALTTQVEALHKDKENLRINLNKAEEEVKLLFEENKILDEENKKLLALLEKERQHRSERKHSSSASTTKHKRKSSSLKDTSPVGRTIDFNGADSSSRHPLSPLPPNSPDYRAHKK
ncbi:hypothetical protein OsI_09561 [Oryza sativa Indica Group]|uniref:Uncharacterized protein n=2 Tax=Oryza TaxID=4527 RepID=A0A0E0GFC6_ORYNI|nr:hypothetical protein OsI_09561 [Oryza sativa Indica Group]